MPDEIIEELWSIKDGIAREHGYDLRKLAAYLQGLEQEEVPSESPGRSILDILADGPSERLFKSAKEVDDYIAEERASWER